MWSSGTSNPTDTGSALLMALLVLALGLTVAGVLALLGASESRVAAAHRDAFETRYAAESALDRAVLELQSLSSWDDVLAGAATASLTLGTGTVQSGGVTVSLSAETARLQARTDARPGHGLNTPRWRPFLWAPFRDLLPGPADQETSLVVLAWVADDEAESDGDPANDSNQAVWIHAAAFGGGNLEGRVEGLVTRAGPAPAPVRRIVWRGGGHGD
jgi:hypothetical protein